MVRQLMVGGRIGKIKNEEGRKELGRNLEGT